MSEIERKSPPPLLGWLTIAAGAVAALASIAVGFGQIKDGVIGICQAFHHCNAPPAIENYETDWVDGGKSTGDYCGRVLDTYQTKYPNFKISMTELPEQHRVQYTPFKHDQYKYSCSFTATSK